jgi:hypothetical protein
MLVHLAVSLGAHWWTAAETCVQLCPVATPLLGTLVALNGEVLRAACVLDHDQTPKAEGSD